MSRDHTLSPTFTRSTRTSRIPLGAAAAWFGALLGIALSIPSVSIAQQFVARVDRQEIAENETLNLEVIYADRADTEAIDFEAALEGFSILSNRPSSQTRIVNFKRSSQTSWQLALMPKRTGRLRIPEFQIGSARTRPIDIRVTQALKGPQDGSPFSAELVVDRDRAFIGEQILVRIILTASHDVADLRGAALEVPGSETQLVGQAEFQRVLEGVAYTATELTYAVFAQNPGALTIPSLQYTGTLRRSRGIVARTDTKAIEILDPAMHPVASQKRPWLPADAIVIADEWSGPKDALRVGEPITRTLRVAAASQRAAAISPLRLPDGPYKQYSEQPILEDTQTSTGILGQRADSIVLVPTQAGPLHLPAIEIDWWNIDEQRWEIARLPEETLQVVAGAAASAPSTDGAAPANGEAKAPLGDQETTAIATRLFDDRVTIALSIVCALLLGCCALLWNRIRRLEARLERPAIDSNGTESAARVQSAFNRALRALTDRNPGDVRRELLAWGRLEWPEFEIRRLEQLAERTEDEALRRMLAALDAHLYGSDSEASDSGGPLAVDWEDLRRRLKELRATRSARPKASDGSALGSLYPAA
jgi:hypothetical protein